ncbi:unnamed protein product [Brugia pahangi]|uniref:Sulfotransfer_1 domain-containing protein n=1 Tax=Brugia pahangi TaxID=6280 RepID=A0A0N4TSI7_BRUPA|nr:unnamed protein product [Brugia pahangi]
MKKVKKRGKLYNANMLVSISFMYYFICNIILIYTYHKLPTVYGMNIIVNDTAMIVQKRFPQAIIIGVKKAGTRALLEFLRLNPAIKAPGPEVHFFDKNFDKGFGWYRLFLK